MSKPKEQHVLLEDRVWSCLYATGFTAMSGEGGAKIQIDTTDPNTPMNQIDVFAMDDEVAIAIECKSFISQKNEPDFQEYIAKHAALRDTLVKTVNSQFVSKERRKIILAMFVSNLVLSDNDRKRAEHKNIALFDDNDLAYYEALTKQLGPAARFQLLCDMAPGGQVRGLDITLPALKIQMGGNECYIFSAHPDYLLKICYVSHRAKGKASDVDAYQRMVSRSRLSKIRQYISENGIFPTNVIISFQEPNRLRFDRGKQEGPDEGAVFGWLHISPTYKSAWIIDGQHRLFAYSGHEFATSSVVPVLAFAGLPASEQAQLFIDINGEQRRVKKNLLQELFAELHWASSDPLDRVAAVISKAIQHADEDPFSPFHDRILRSDEARSPTRCISLASLFRSLDKPGFYVNKMRKGSIVEYGPLWAVESSATLERTLEILNGWFRLIQERNLNWWEAGSGDGGGLAMNDGVTICINVLRSVLLFLKDQDKNLDNVTNKDLMVRLNQYGIALGDYLSSLDNESKQEFRRLRGGQGQDRGTRMCQAGIKQHISEFNPAGLKDWMDQESKQTTQRARIVVDAIEIALQKIIMLELRQEFKGEEWWFSGVPQKIRLKASQRREEDQGKRGNKEAYFDLIDYREIIKHNWSLFSELLSFDHGSKDRRTEWISKVNDIRKRVMHASSGAGVSTTELEEIESIKKWLKDKLSPNNEKNDA